MTFTTHTSARWRAHGLPAELTSFVGRRREVAEVKLLLSKARLVTLTGVGGVGKTRLAHRVAAEVRPSYPDGVWLVELADLANPDLLVNTVVDALDIQDQSSRPAMEAVVEHLRERNTLIILDNCEHLLNDSAILADTILHAAPDVRFLITSRQVLGITGEQTMAVPTLSLPPPASGAAQLSAEQLAQFDAVRLFTERAQAVLPDFAVTADNRDAIERICRCLDGIPLAIELAAVRLRVLSVDQLLDRLGDRFRLLDCGSRTVLPRHRTLRALIDWSYTLCTCQERLLWARASVFSGSIDLEAAAEICGGGGIDPEEVFDLVSGMVNKSVFMREEHGLGIRYRLLETMRQYGRDRLAESGEEDDLLRRHRDFYQRRCAESNANLFGPSELSLITRFKLDHPNLRSALDYCFATAGEAANGLTMATDLLYHWTTGYLREGRRRLEQGLAEHREPTLVRARGLVVNSWLSIIQGQIEEAPTMLDEARKIAEDHGDAAILGDVDLHRGLLALDRGDADLAVELCERGTARLRSIGDLARLALAYSWVVSAHTLRGDLDEAVRVAEEGIALCERHGDDLHRAYHRTMLGVALWRLGDTRRPHALAKESLAFQRSLGNPRGIAISLSLLAWTTATEGRYEKAARLLGVLRTFSNDPWSRRAIGVPVSGYRHLAPYQDECEAQIREAIGPAGLEAALNWGARLDVEDALSYALGEDPLGEEPEEEKALERYASLTRREREIARLVARGMSNRQIAAELLISQRTAEGHVRHILNKLGFNSRTQIAIWVERQRNGDGPGAPS